MNSIPFKAADILLPKKDFESWSVIACDQFTSRREYWEETARIAAGKPSTLNLIFPEVYLEDGDADDRIASIRNTMNKYLEDGVFECYENALIYVERTQPDGRIRCGIVGAVDLEEYDYRPDARCEIRATERTVMERIPPRVKIRKAASLELPHVMMLIDDPQKTVIEALQEKKSEMKKLYSFTLMQGGGSIEGYLIPSEWHGELIASIGALKNHEGQILFAVGDGNHSLATAKACYAENPTEINRYSLVELVNIHSDALDFEPIYRTVEGVDAEKFCADFKQYLSDKGATLIFGEAQGAEMYFTLVRGDKQEKFYVKDAPHALAVGVAQDFIDLKLSEGSSLKTDYIHGEDEVCDLAKRDGCVGILYDGLTKDGLFYAVEKAGVLPRKTFSMGHARDKRYYTEARKIVK